jgi:hypothetical protein
LVPARIQKNSEGILQRLVAGGEELRRPGSLIIIILNSEFKTSLHLNLP